MVVNNLLDRAVFKHFSAETIGDFYSDVPIQSSSIFRRVGSSRRSW